MKKSEKEDLIDIKFGLMEVLAGNLYAASEPDSKKPLSKLEMYKTKIRLPILESILMENGQFLSWLFTSSNGYVMEKSSKKLSKEAIILHFIHKIKKYFKTHSTPLEVTDDQFLSDLNQFCSVADQNYSKPHLFQHPKVRYLLQIDKMKFIFVYFIESSRNEFMNILEFVKIINDSNKMNTITLIQNFISIHSFGKKAIENDLLLSKDKVRYLIVKYEKRDEKGSNRLSLYYNKPKLLERIDCEFKGKTMKEITKKRLMRKGSLTESKGENIEVIKQEDNNELIMVNNENQISTIEKIIAPFLKLIENKRHIAITHASMTFIKVKNGEDEYYAFQHGDRLIGVNNCGTMTMNNSILTNAQQLFHQYEKVNKDAICFGDFCEYIIPQYFKNIKKNNAIDELNKKLIPSSNKFTSREKNDKLPYSLPVFQIKKAYDNPHLVNVVLKAYSIFPKKFDKEAEMAKIIKERREAEEKKRMRDKNKEEERRRLKEKPSQTVTSAPSEQDDALGLGTSFDSLVNEMNNGVGQNKKNTAGITLYTPTPNKFRKENYDVMYNSRFVCENCFRIYTLIHCFLSNIDETTFQFKSLSKAKDILLQGENLNLNLNAFEDQNQIRNEENLLFQEEIQEISLKKMIKKNLLKEKLTELQRKQKKDKVKIGRTSLNKKEEFNRAFSYKIDINPRLLKLNLVAEKSKNKFFKLIFNELKSEPESLYQKLCIQKPDHEGKSTMKALRMHMGINSHIYNPELTQFQFAAAKPDFEEEYFANIKQSLENKEMHQNAQRENNQIDNDIFLTYKNALKKSTVSPDERNSSSEQEAIEISEQNSESDSEEEEEEKAKAKGKGKGRKELCLHENEEDNNDNQKFLDLSLINEKEEVVPNYAENHRIDRGSANINISSNFNSSNEYDTSLRRKGIRSKTVVLKKSNDPGLNTNIKQQEKKSGWKKTCTEFTGNNKPSSSVNLPILVINDLRMKYSNNTFKEREKKKKETLYREKQIKLKQFIQIDQAAIQKKKEEKQIMNSNSNAKTIKEKKNEKKITLFTLVNDRTSTYKYDVPYYYISSPLPKLNEGNIPVTENPLLSTQNITINEYIQMGKFKPSNLLSSCEIFVYDANTAIPFKVLNEKTKSGASKVNPATRNRMSISVGEKKSRKLLIVVINDFFDSYGKYEEEISEVCRLYWNKVEELKCVLFNLPGQSSTMWSKKCVMNNMYYSTFLDRFLFYLSMKQYFDQSYSIIFVGFGNGGNIALTYTSFYEKYCDFIHSVVMINSYCNNDDFLDRSMVEILQIINHSKNHKLVDFFIKSVTVNPQTLINLNIDQGKEVLDDNPNPMTLAGYHNITKGYFFNLKINHKEIKTKIVAAHSNQNCFISINNLNPLFNKKINYFVTKGVEIPSQKYLISQNNTNSNKDNWKESKDLILETEAKSTKYNNTSYGNANNNTQDKPNNAHTLNRQKDIFSEPIYLEYNYDLMLSKDERKLIVIDGSHDLKYNDSPCINNILLSYLKFIGNNNLFQVNR